MSLQECKIGSYKTGVSSLPDYPSDAGYTAAALKAVFDARSDGEIREKHNALVDEIAESIAQAEASAKAYADSLGVNYDSAGSAAAAEANAKAYAESLAPNYDAVGSAAMAEANAKAYADNAIAAAISAIPNGDEVSY